MQRTDTQSLERREIFVPRSAVVVEGGNQRKIRALASNSCVDRYNSRVNPLGMRPPQSGSVAAPEPRSEPNNRPCGQR